MSVVGAVGAVEQGALPSRAPPDHSDWSGPSSGSRRTPLPKARKRGWKADSPAQEVRPRARNGVAAAFGGQPLEAAPGLLGGGPGFSGEEVHLAEGARGRGQGGEVDRGCGALAFVVGALLLDDVP